MLRLETFGGLTLTSDQTERPQRRRRIALLARLAAASERGVSRDELLAVFWPESDAEGARHSLDQLLYEMRRALGASPTIGTTTLRLDPAAIACDLTDWTSAIARGDLERAVALYRGPFLHGFYLQSSPGFERWVESVRGELALQHRRALEALATKASAEGRLGAAVEWWRRLAADDRFGSRAALGLMRALVDAGDRAGALQFAHLHERVVLAELESAPDPAVAAYAAALRTSPPSERTMASTANATMPKLSPNVSSIAAAPATVPASPPVGAWRRNRTLVLAGVSALVLAMILYGATAFGRNDATRGSPVVRRGIAASTRRRALRGTTNLAAYDLYQHGNDLLLQRSDSGIQHAIADLEQAIALDSNYAQAYAALARVYVTASSFQFSLSPTERQSLHSRAVAAASRAIALDNSLADAHAELGYILALGLDPVPAIAELKRSIELDSTVSPVYEVLAKSYEWVGRPNDAIAAARRAVATDSMSASAVAEVGDALYFNRRYDEALAQLRKIVAVQPPLRRTASYLAQVYLVKHQWKDAIDALEPGATKDRLTRGLLGYALARSGRQPEARRLLDQMVATRSAPAAMIAEVYVGLRQYDSAFVWLDRSFDDYSMQPAILGPLFDDVHARPEFGRVRQRLGLPPR